MNIKLLLSPGNIDTTIQEFKRSCSNIREELCTNIMFYENGETSIFPKTKHNT